MAARKTPLPTRQVVRQYKNGASAKALADKYGCTQGTILRALREAKVEIRPRGGTKRVALPVESVVRDYVDNGLSTTALATKHGVSASTITRTLVAADVTLRPRNTAKQTQAIAA